MAPLLPLTRLILSDSGPTGAGGGGRARFLRDVTAGETGQNVGLSAKQSRRQRDRLAAGLAAFLPSVRHKGAGEQGTRDEGNSRSPSHET